MRIRRLIEITGVAVVAVAALVVLKTAGPPDIVTPPAPVSANPVAQLAADCIRTRASGAWDAGAWPGMTLEQFCVAASAKISAAEWHQEHGTGPGR